MTGKILGRRLGFLIAAAAAVLPALIQPLSAAAAPATGTLFGVAGGAVVVSVNPTTAALTTIVTLDINPANVRGYTGLANDPATHRLFMIQNIVVDGTVSPPVTAFRVVTIDSQTRVVTFSPNLTSAVGDTVFDTSSGTLIGMTAGSQLVRVDPTTGVITPLATLAGSRFSPMVLSAATHSLYIASSSTTFPPTTVILTVDTLNWTISQSPTLNMSVFTLAYDSSSRALFGKTHCCWQGPNPPGHLVRIDPATGAEIGVGPDLYLGGAFTIDPATHTVFTTRDVLGAFSFDEYIWSINNQTGAYSSSPALPGGTLSTLLFEPITDTSPPATSINLFPAPNAGGWNKTNVTVNLSATDPDGVADVATIDYSAAGAQPIAPTVVAGSSASFSLTTEGATTVTYFAKDRAGNTEAAHTQLIRIDKTPPTITYTSNASTYTVDQTVSITCTAADPPNANGTPGSGLDSTTCLSVNAPAYSFPLGPNTLSATATDIAGNVGTGSTTFTVQVTSAGLCTLTLQFIESSPRFQALPPGAQERWREKADRLCELLADAAQTENDPEASAESIAAYRNALRHLVARKLLASAQSAILLTLSKAL